MTTRPAEDFPDLLFLEYCKLPRVLLVPGGHATYFSVRSATNTHISTFDLSLRQENTVLKVFLNDHRSLQNKLRPQDAASAVRAFIRQLQSGAWESKVVVYLEHAEALRSSHGRFNDALKGLDLNARRLATREVLRDHLPKMLQRVLTDIRLLPLSHPIFNGKT